MRTEGLNLAYFRISPLICSASSRVGASTSTCGRLGSTRPQRSTAGRPKAAVLPVPVEERPTMSCPSRISGIAAAWIGVISL